jgi:hypothetical protein
MKLFKQFNKSEAHIFQQFYKINIWRDVLGKKSKIFRSFLIKKEFNTAVNT